jgi:hypothetical protein
MTQEKKMRSLIFVIIFLVIANIILLLFLIFGRKNQHRQHTRDRRSVIETFVQDKIGFNKQQMDIYENMRQADFEKRVPIFDSLKAAKSRFYEDIYNDTVPDSIINKIALAVSEKQMDVDKHMLQYFKQVRKICTAEQLPKFDSSFRDIVERITSIRLRSNKH